MARKEKVMKRMVFALIVTNEKSPFKEKIEFFISDSFSDSLILSNLAHITAVDKGELIHDCVHGDRWQNTLLNFKFRDFSSRRVEIGTVCVRKELMMEITMKKIATLMQVVASATRWDFVVVFFWVKETTMILSFLKDVPNNCYDLVVDQNRF